ncbi:MAG: DEAD/DEAH box helicase family protein [Desulfobacterales bacterium]|nr:DEAD/DEAH box helicase family protein [Desulfobacterales bacterium]
MINISVPEPGQLADVRHRRFVVTDIQKSSLHPDLSAQGLQKPMDIVTLSSIEDDAMGEELQVLWQIEPGTRIFEKAALPSPGDYDDPLRLDAFLDAVRWGAVSSADIQALQSPFRSGINIEDYQLDPVVRALRMPRVNLLIADDVGLGKTIEAGLVIQELILRHRARTVLVVCPASLQVQWQEQMRDKFGLEFCIIDSKMMKQLRRERGLHVNPWNHFPRLITSIDFLKRDRPVRLFRELLPAHGKSAYPRRFDMLIVDEAHNVAPSGSGNYAIPSLRTKTILTLAPHFEHKLFLTATPHNGYPESFSALLELLDNQRFARAVKPTQAQLAAVMVRRLKTELFSWDGAPRFPTRVIEPLEVDYSKEEQTAHQKLREYTDQRRQSFSDGSEKYAMEFVLKLLKKRLFSSPAAFQSTLEQHIKTVHGSGQNKRTGVKRPTLEILRKRLEEIEEDFADDEVYENDTAEAVENATSLVRPLTPEEETVLAELKNYAEKASAVRDSKADTLIRWLDKTLRPDGKWNNERVLIFTEYRTTQKWLHDILVAENFARNDRLMMIYGGMETKEREEVKAAFQTNPEKSSVRILLATDAASEGLDLQNYCHRLIHYEIPWNPNRLEQRNGRLDRHGQKSSDVLIYHFVTKGFETKSHGRDVSPGDLEGDLEFLMRAVVKVNQIREDLGKVGPVIADQVEKAMMGQRTTLDTRDAEQAAAVPRRQLRFERDLRNQIAKLHEQLQESRRTLRVSPENVHAVVSVALELAKQPSLRETELTGVFPDSEGRQKSCPVYIMPDLRGNWARCSEGIAHPHTGEIRPVTFDHSVAHGRDDVVLIHLNHRLVQMATRLLRAEIWSSDSNKYLNRVTARLVPDGILNTPGVIAFGRLVVLGGVHHRLHEEIITAGGIIRDARFKKLNVTQVQDALKAALPDPVSEDVKKRLTGLWSAIEKPLFQSLESRMRDRTKNLQKLLGERKNREVRDITEVLSQLAENIAKELKAEPPQQLSLWSDPEQEQFERNRGSLQARLEEIPDEIEREIKAVHKRYYNPTPRLFPVAVAFLVPSKLAGEHSKK